MEVLVHYADLSLKGRNRAHFAERLVRNIRSACGGDCRASRDHIVMRGGDWVKLKNVFGISWYAPCFTCPKDMENVVNLCLSEVEREVYQRKDAKTFAVYVKRSEKSFPVLSSEIQSVVGEKIRLRFGLEVNISAPDLPVHIRIDRDAARLHFEKTAGAGGLPVGSSAPLLCLLSGGIDSPVAAFLSMKRGCEVDFLHFHVFPDSYPVADTKIPLIFSTLGRYQPHSRMFLASYKFFQKQILRTFPQDHIFSGYTVVLFRRFMMKVAESLASLHGYKAMVTGDCIGQVASQTVENISCAYAGLGCAVLSPLLGMDKDEIVKKARQIGTYEQSTKPYNECCSIVSQSPRTRCRISTLRRLEREISMQTIVEETMRSIGHPFKTGFCEDFNEAD